MKQFGTTISIFDMTSNDIDRVGGAIVTGSLLYERVLCRIEAVPSRMATNLQGMETERRIDCTVADASLVINERDEILVTSPVKHPYYNQRLRVSSVSYDSMIGPSAHVELLLTYIVQARTLP